MAADQKAQDWDLLDFVDMMLATGKRIGETCAITWDALDLGAGTVEFTEQSSGEGPGAVDQARAEESRRVP